MDTTTPLLSIDKLDVAFTNYGIRHHVLRQVSLQVGDGERVALIGETGSGKSLTSKAVLGTLPEAAHIETGTIKFDGKDLLNMPHAEREAMKGTAFSIIMQDPQSSFNPVFKIGRHLDDVMKYADLRLGEKTSARDRRQRIFEVLRKVQLQDPQRVFDAYPNQLSGGMRQRVLIALSLLHHPRMLIADEPGTALDVTTQDEIIKLINQLVDENGLSLLMITHNLGLVRQTADRVYVMRQGEIVEEGGLSSLFANPQTEYTRNLMDSIPALYGSRVTDQSPVESDPIVTLKGVGKVFSQRSLFGAKKGFEAVKDVTLSVKKGEVFGLAGESGSGKTTLARMIMGMIKPTSGEVRIDGKAHSEFSGDRSFQRMTQIVYQNPGTSLNPKRTVAQTLGVPLSFAGIHGKARRERLHELMAQVDLTPSYLSKYPHELSGGQKQRVAIARALAANPRIIVLDEPTSALDVSVQRNVISLLQKLRDELGITYLFISHDLSLMRNFCSHIAVMFKGQIVEQGTPASVFDNPEHPYTRALISAIPVMSEEEEQHKPKVTAEERAQFLVQSAG